VDTSEEPRTEQSERADAAASASGSQTAVDLSLLDELTTDLAEVQGALERLDNGTYGYCEHCGDPIDDSSLESSPTVRLCVAHLPFGPAGGPEHRAQEHPDPEHWAP
jgi:DnaK suppressor protein